MSASGELIVGEALADPASSTIYRWDGNTHVATDGPYAETKEHLPGSSSSTWSRASEPRRSVLVLAHPGDVIELRPAMWAGTPTRERAGYRRRLAGVRSARARCASSGATDMSTPPRTHCRKRSWRPLGSIRRRPAGRSEGLVDPGGVAQAHRSAARRRRCARRGERVTLEVTTSTLRRRAREHVRGLRRHSRRDAAVLPSVPEPPSQVALTLRAVAGLTTVQIARSFLVPESTMARIVRAKARLGGLDPSGLPPVTEMPGGWPPSPTCCTSCTPKGTRRRRRQPHHPVARRGSHPPGS